MMASAPSSHSTRLDALSEARYCLRRVPVRDAVGLVARSISHQLALTFTYSACLMQKWLEQRIREPCIPRLERQSAPYPVHILCADHLVHIVPSRVGGWRLIHVENPHVRVASSCELKRCGRTHRAGTADDKDTRRLGDHGVYNEQRRQGIVCLDIPSL